MQSMPEHWQRLSRKKIVDTKFTTVYQDSVQLPTGVTIDDYTVVALSNGVIIVATDKDNKLLTQFEYKYAIDRVILNLPSGGVEGGESPLEAAAKELLEETGYVSEELELVQVVYEYPSKLDHVLYIVRAKNAHKVQETTHEDTESISEVHLISADMSDYGGIFDTTYNITALALTLPEFLRRPLT